MAKYTQTLYEYMDNLGLDPFNEDDLIVAGRKLLSVEYDVPKGVMDNLLKRFVLRYIDNEIDFYYINKFRLHLMRYAIEQRPRYEKMFNLFNDMDPFEFINQRTEREMSQSVKDDLLKELRRELDGTVKNLTKTDAERTNINTRTEREGITSTTDQNITESGNRNENRNDTLNKDGSTTSNLTGTETTNEHTDGSRTQEGGIHKTGGSNTTETKSGTDTLNRESRDAEGFGSINSFAEPGIMVNETVIGDGTDTTLYNSQVEKDVELDETTTEDSTTIDDTTTKTSGSKTSRDNTTRKDKEVNIGTTSERDNRDRKQMGMDTRDSETAAQMSGRGENKSTVDGLEKRDTITTEDETRKGEKETKGTEIETITGLIKWKPELAKQFYEMFIVVDEEWVRNARDLFSYIY